MINFTVYDLLWMFFIYSFLGWLFETVSASLKQKKFANRGLVNGPFCVLYGITAVIITVGLQELTGVWLFLFAMIYATVVEWIAGHLIELAFKERWWDYSNVKWNFDGYVCVPVSVFWGFLGYVIVKWGNKITLKINKTDEEKSTENNDNLENKLISEIKKIQKVDIKIDENQTSESEEKSNITKTDIENVKSFLISEYGVSKTCLKIN